MGLGDFKRQVRQEEDLKVGMQETAAAAAANDIFLFVRIEERQQSCKAEEIKPF